MNAVAGGVFIVFFLLAGVMIAFIVDQIRFQRRSKEAGQMQSPPPRIWSPQAQDNVRAYWRVAGRPALDKQLAVVDALAVLQAAEERLAAYYPLTDRPRHDI